MLPDRTIPPVRASARKWAVAAALLAGAAAFTPALAQWTAPPDDTVMRILTERIERAAAVGLVAGFIEDGSPRIVASGHRAGEASPEVDAATVFEIGSIAKVFTTTLLAEMVARGEVALEDPISRFLPPSVRAPSRDGSEITLLDLATATSGLPRLPAPFTPADVTNPYADYGVDDLYAFLSSYELPRDPGATYEYSNLGMGLLGHLLALRAGMSYEELVVQRILAPLGMQDTRIELTPTMRERLAPGHGADLAPAPNWDFAVLAGAGAWRSTADDMLRFVAAMLSPPAGALGEALAMAIEPRRPTGSAGLEIALGWHVLERADRRIVWHNGQTAGYHAFLGVDPESGANAVVLANAATDIDDIGLHVLDPTIPVRQVTAPAPTVAVDAAVLERYVGRYELAPEFAIDITREDDRLFAQATGQQRFSLFAASPTRFFLRAVEAEISFTMDENDDVTGLVLHQGGRETPGRRVR